jgi:hypothetical protein
LTDLFERVVIEDTNQSLCNEFTEEEISNALFQIDPLKAPGPDGFPARFFQRNWTTLREDVVHAVKLFLRRGGCQRELMTLQ